MCLPVFTHKPLFFIKKKNLKKDMTKTAGRMRGNSKSCHMGKCFKDLGMFTWKGEGKTGEKPGGTWPSVGKG